MIKTLLVDSHVLMREGIKAILSTVGDIIVAGEIDNAKSVLKKIHEQHWDIVLLDISLPDKAGIDVLKEIKSKKPSLPVLVLSSYPENQYGMRAIKSGASGYLMKTCMPRELIMAIHKVAAGGKYMSDWLTELLIDQIGKPHESPLHAALSDREFEILRLIAAGKSIKCIAQMLYLSVSTVSTYRGRILKKMNMQSDAQLITYAITNRIFSEVTSS